MFIVFIYKNPAIYSYLVYVCFNCFVLVEDIYRDNILLICKLIYIDNHRRSAKSNR